MLHPASETSANHGHALLHGQAAFSVLAVEDDAMARELLREQVALTGHDVMTAANGREALDILLKDPDSISAVLLDLEMPVMNGLTLIRHMRDNPRLHRIPVILVTGANAPADMERGLEAGVFYYLTKPLNETLLRSVLRSAIRQSEKSRALTQELQKHKAGFQLIDTCKMHYRTLAEMEHLAAFAALCFPNPQRVYPGLSELLTNALEHGMFGMGPEKKAACADHGAWRREIERLQSDAAHLHKSVEVTLARKPDGVYIMIQDPGPGFEWQKHIRIDPARAGENHGRGIAQAAALSFDKISYNKAGNQVAAFVSHKSKMLEW